MTLRVMKSGGLLATVSKGKQVPLKRRNGSWIVDPHANCHAAALKDPAFVAEALRLAGRQYPSTQGKPPCRRVRKSPYRR